MGRVKIMKKIRKRKLTPDNKRIRSALAKKTLQRKWYRIYNRALNKGETSYALEPCVFCLDCRWHLGDSGVECSMCLCPKYICNGTRKSTLFYRIAKAHSKHKTNKFLRLTKRLVDGLEKLII